MFFKLFKNFWFNNTAEVLPVSKYEVYRAGTYRPGLGAVVVFTGGEAACIDFVEDNKDSIRNMRIRQTG